MNKFVNILCIVIAVIAVGCKSSSVGKYQNSLYKESDNIQQAMVQAKEQATNVSVKLDKIEESSQTAYNAISSVLLVTPAVGSPQVQESLKTSLKANADILVDVQAAKQSTDAILGVTKEVTVSAKEVGKAANNVQDVVGFWESLGSGIRKVVTLLTLALVVIVGWRFGLDTLVKSVLGFVSKGIMVVSNWFYAKYDGPVKLIKEGKVNEGIAALRSAVPGLNRSFSKTGGKDGTGA
jgi:hypothetical protein